MKVIADALTDSVTCLVSDKRKQIVIAKQDKGPSIYKSKAACYIFSVNIGFE